MGRLKEKKCCRELDTDHLEVTCPKCKGEGTLARHEVGEIKTQVDHDWDSISSHVIPGKTIEVIGCLSCRGRGTIPSKTGLQLLEFFNAYKDYDASVHPLIGKWKQEDKENDPEDEDD